MTIVTQNSKDAPLFCYIDAEEIEHIPKSGNNHCVTGNLDRGSLMDPRRLKITIAKTESGLSFR